MPHSLIVLPDDSAQPILSALAQAKQSLRIKMFLFSDPALLSAVIDAHKRGVKVRVMLNPARRDGEEENATARAKLTHAGIEVADSNPAFALTHEKSMVVDDALAFVKSLNWETKNLTVTRDYSVVTDLQHEVEEIVECFEADWHRHEFAGGANAQMIWCRGNGRERIAAFIDAAKHSLWLQNERYQDPVIIEHLVRAATRGVKVHVMARAPHKLKKEKLGEAVGGLKILADVGVKVHVLKKLKLHAKALLGDHARAIVGSINLAPGSFDNRRELSIETGDTAVVERLRAVMHDDWDNSHRLDLSDEGLLAELERHGGEGVEDLGLGSEPAAEKKDD